jgi:hypothetical protein
LQLLNLSLERLDALIAFGERGSDVGASTRVGICRGQLASQANTAKRMTRSALALYPTGIRRAVSA